MHLSLFLNAPSLGGLKLDFKRIRVKYSNIIAIVLIKSQLFYHIFPNPLSKLIGQ